MAVRRSPKPLTGVRFLGQVPSGRGGIGRRACLRSTWASPVRVRVPPPRPATDRPREGPFSRTSEGLIAANNASRGGVEFFTLLGLLFIGLKLAGLIDWAWWVVLAPILGQFAIAAVLFLGCLLAMSIAEDD